MEDIGMFCGPGKFTGCEKRVENEERDVADSIKTSKQAESLRIRMLTPSEPVAEEFLMEDRTDRGDCSEMELSEKAQAPTPGGLQGSGRSSP